MKVLDYSTVSEISSITSKLAKMKKQLWKSDRKYYNKVKDEFPSVDRLKEKATYLIMSSNELYDVRGIEMLLEMERISIKFKSLIPISPYQEELSQIIDEIGSTIVLIKLSDHQDSIFDSF